MKSHTFVLLLLGAATIASAEEIRPPLKENLIKANIRRAAALLKSDHKVHTTWPEHRAVDTVVRSPKAINSVRRPKTLSPQ